ncbi:MAG: hypothetical protein HY532_02660 [Chloroflexi bacterium]|nr:hypothetical protein [Chloroflexota bacterium]
MGSRKRVFLMALFGVMALLMAMTSAAVFGQEGGAQVAGLEQAIAAQERHTDRLLQVQGVVGTAVGLGAGGKAAVFVFIERGDVAGIPSRLDGVQVIPQVTGKFEALHHRDGHTGGPGGGGSDPTPTPTPTPSSSCSRTEWCPRPVPIGVSTGHPDITAGTIGARVKDTAGNVYALSNNHVYANSNAATIGDSVLQPGPYDGGDVNNPDHILGYLAAFKPILFDGSNNTIDAAIATTTTVHLGNSTLPGGYGTPASGTIAPNSLLFNQKVLKYGRTTGQTEGRVWAINATVNVGYGDGKVAKFVGQIIITPGTFSAGGDSGSLIVDKATKKAIGLLFAGSSSYTIANPIDLVLSEFGVTIDGA